MLRITDFCDVRRKINLKIKYYLFKIKACSWIRTPHVSLAPLQLDEKIS